MPIVNIPLAQLRPEIAGAMRAKTDHRRVAEYAQLPADAFPPPVVIQDDRTGEFWMGEGILRMEAAEARGELELAVDLRPGMRRDAYVHAARSNARHGLPRTWADKRAVVRKLLLDPQYAGQSDEWFAQTCAVSRTFVARTRKRMARPEDADPRRGIDGRVRRLPQLPSLPSDADSSPESLPEPPPPELSPRDQALAMVVQAKAEIHAAIHEAEIAERLLRDGSTRKLMNALKAAKRALNAWHSDLDRRPAVPPLPDPSDTSEEAEIQRELYRIARMSGDEILDLARKMLSHDMAMLADGPNSSAPASPSDSSLWAAARGRDPNQPETLHPRDGGIAPRLAALEGPPLLRERPPPTRFT